MSEFDVRCGPETTGFGALIRLTPGPLFFSRYPSQAVEYAVISGQVTHEDTEAYDAY